MKRLFRVLVVVAIVMIGVGFYRGWFSLSSPDADDGSNKVNLNLTMDADKMKEDAKAVTKKSTELTDNVTDGEKNPDDHATDNVKSRE
jgi:hypothetical protein